MTCCSIVLPIAIVDLLNANDVSYGEVIVLDMVDAVPSGGSQECTTVTLGFTNFEGTYVLSYIPTVLLKNNIALNHILSSM